MNTLRFLLCFAALSFAPLFGQVTTSVATPASPAPAVAPVLSKGDAVLDFILKKAERYSGSIEEGISQAVDFAKEQIPQAIVEFLRWRSYRAIWNMAFPVLVVFCLAAFTFIAYRLGKRWNNNGVGDGFGEWMMPIVGSIATVISIGFALHAIYDNVPTLIQIHVAPRVYLIEEAMKLVHK